MAQAEAGVEAAILNLYFVLGGFSQYTSSWRGPRPSTGRPRSPESRRKNQSTR